MQNRQNRPLGIAVLTFLHIAVGIVGSLGVLVALFVGVIGGGARQGIPLVWLLAVAVPGGFGVWLGLGLLNGKTWSWYVASSLYGLLFLLGSAGAHAAARELVFPDRLSTALFYLAYAVHAIVTLTVYFHLMRTDVRGFFSLDRLAPWKPIVGQSVVGLALAIGTGFYVGGVASAWNVNRIDFLGSHGATFDDAELRFVLDRLEKGRTNERITAAWALGRSGRVDIEADLLRAASTDSSVIVRSSAVGSLVALGVDDIEKMLLEFLEDESDHVRTTALAELARLGVSASADLIGGLLDGDSLELRAAAVDTLGKMGDPNAMPYLQSATGDPEEEVRSRAAFALGKLGDTRAVPTLISMLDDDEWAVRANAAQALGMIGDESARAHLARLTDDPNPQVRWAAEDALRRLP